MDTRKRATERLKEIERNISNALVIHYSCESFKDKVDGYSPRIAAICVRAPDSGQTYSFSIHRVAELRRIPREEIETHYDELERAMLDDFFGFVAQHKSDIFVHWNMRDANYGFQALYHRHRVLSGEPVIVADSQLVDLARVMVDAYGRGYAKDPRLQNLVELNNIGKKNFLTGAEEAAAFANKEYIRLHLSTLSKVDCIDNVLTLLLAGKLRVAEKPIGRKVREINDHWGYKGVALLLAALAILGYLGNVVRLAVGP